MEFTRLFLRMGADVFENARTVIDFTLMQLEMRSQQTAAAFENFGEGSSRLSRPWILVFSSEPNALKEAVRDKPLETRRWMQDIRICHIETIHQVKAILSSVHIQDISGTNLLAWMQLQRGGQPPCLIVVMDMLRLLLPFKSTDPRQIRHDDLARALALLIETCGYLSIHARKKYDNAFGIETGFTTDLLVTDEGCLESMDFEDERDESWMKKAIDIIDFYVDREM